jgi:hypothetical protein
MRAEGEKSKKSNHNDGDVLSCIFPGSMTKGRPARHVVVMKQKFWLISAKISPKRFFLKNAVTNVGVHV